MARLHVRASRACRGSRSSRLVQVGAASSGSGGPASGGGGGTPPSVAQLPAGMPAETQAWKAATAAAGTAVFGGGGIGDVEACIRATNLAPLLCEGSPGDGAWRAASVARDWGAPPPGVES